MNILNVIYSCDAKLHFSGITLVSSVTWFYRNYSNHENSHACKYVNSTAPHDASFNRLFAHDVIAVGVDRRRRFTSHFFLTFPLMNNTFSYTMKSCVFSIWSIWAFINSTKHRHLEFLLLIPMEKKITSVPSRVIRITCLKTTYIPLYHSAVTAHAHRKSRVHSNKALTRNVYVMLVYVFLIAVALLCCDMLWYSWSVQRWSNLYWSAPRYSLLTFVDNTALPGFFYFIHVHLMFPYTESSFLFISHWFTRSDVH